MKLPWRSKRVPDFRKTVETEDSNCEFADLEPAFISLPSGRFTPGMRNSIPTRRRRSWGTLGFAAEKLATPTELAAADVTSSGAKISWAEVSGAANYRVVVKTTSDGNEVSSAVVSATSYTASGSRPVRIIRFRFRRSSATAPWRMNSIRTRRRLSS